jgi:acetyl esterase/lipase
MSMPEVLSHALRTLGSVTDFATVQALYAPWLSEQPRDGVRCVLDQAYGQHERQRLDIYAPASGGPHPVLVWFHGGGFVRGDKQQRANIGYWGAREGFVTVLPNYRLAPQHRWPSGPEDVVRVWQWVQSEGAGYGCARDRVVLGGESAGAAHVAAATLWRRFQLHSDGAIAGAVLLSGPYNARLEGLARKQLGIATPDRRNEAYFGSERHSWDAASIVDHIDVAPLPLWIGFAERDLLQMQVQACELFARLVSQYGFMPELTLLREHNHFSGGCSLGTADTTVSAPLSAFLSACR